MLNITDGELHAMLESLEHWEENYQTLKAFVGQEFTVDNMKGIITIKNITLNYKHKGCSLCIIKAGSCSSCILNKTSGMICSFPLHPWYTFSITLYNINSLPYDSYFCNVQIFITEKLVKCAKDMRDFIKNNLKKALDLKYNKE